MLFENLNIIINIKRVIYIKIIENSDINDGLTLPHYIQYLPETINEFLSLGLQIQLYILVAVIRYVPDLQDLNKCFALFCISCRVGLI